ncbi:14556_t:CDS:1 [Funneliformis caledonium]|uniref:14556_t:CDS:1 n=1 Tax=Funneliformis caledonium TaxID=1117310 RepID=A0A9N8ZGD0_9GLOM|nr:14556_t:CDS:1 [Funneliformis caledonium]
MVKRADDVSIQENETQSSRNSSRQTSPRITREQERFQGLLRELSTPAKGEQAEVDDNDDVGTSVFQSLAKLYQKAIRAGLRVAKANQEEILCWHRYAEGCEKRVNDIRANNV